jgi:prepilin-type N-terminal cleavage/methylation domain-containing protein/prepilin-type processing-associated H-X9-DG protein
MRKAKGFTLIELLVVIAIIALLMAVLMPALQRVKQQGAKTACQANLKQMGLVVSMYTGDFDGKFHEESPSGPQYSWVYAMRPYYSHAPEIRNCPSVNHFYSDTGGRGGPRVGWGVYGEDGYATPGYAVKGDYGSYGWNWWLCDENREDKHWRNINSIPGNRNEIPVFVDALWVDALPRPTDQPPNGYFTHIDRSMGSFCIDRHNGTVNGVFVDFSVRSIGLKELWEIKWYRGWSADRRAAGTPVWPDWMKNFKDYAPVFESPLAN